MPKKEIKPTILCVAEGLMIFSKYPETDHAIAAAHDVIYAGHSGDKGKDLISKEDQETLAELRWHWADDVDCWEHYV